jgi:predicted nucleotidyltransferase
MADIFNRDKMNTKEIISKVTEKLRTYYNPKEIILFGSYASGNPDKGSDLDLLIIKDTDEKFRQRALNVRRVLIEENGLIGLDILVYTPNEIARRLEMGDSFLSKIMKEGIILYG